MLLFTQTDFPAIVIAARLVASGRGHALYDLDAQLQEQHKLEAEGYLRLPPGWKLEYPYPYTPFIAVLWSPLVALSPLDQMALWDLLNLAAMVVGLWYLLTALPLPPFTRAALLLAALTCLPFIVNLQQGQTSGLTMLAFGMGIRLLREGRDLPAGLILGLLAFKVQWLPVLGLVLLWKQRWRVIAGMVSTGFGLLVVTALTMGVTWVPGYLQVLWRVPQGGAEFELDPWYGHGLSGGLAALLGLGSAPTVRLLSAVAALLIVAGLLYVWRGDPGWQIGTAQWDGRMALTMQAILFTNPQLNTHDLCLFALPAALGTAYLGRSNAADTYRPVWYGMLWSGYFISAFALYTGPVRLTSLVQGAVLAFLAVRLVRRHWHRALLGHQPTGS